MIGKLKGLVEQIDLESVILDVSGVGYLVYCAAKTLHSLEIGANCTMYIETIVREDSIKLFGFASNQEKDLFIVLQSVNGVGAKMSLNIISHISIDELYLAITTRDKARLVSVPGVGNKIAERIIIELKGKKIFSNPLVNITDSTYNDSQDAIAALISLGITRNDACMYVEKILLNEPEAKIDDIIKQALILRNK
jgi:Holliday junction DNA helicase RuvA